MRFVLAMTLALVPLFAACDSGSVTLPDVGSFTDFGTDAAVDASALDGAVADLGAADLGAADLGAADLGAADLGEGDFGTQDASLDSGATDAAATEGFGTIAGPCGRLDGELTDGSPWLFETRLDFMSDAFDDPEERPLLTVGAQEILAEGTAGGSSGLSEAFAYEVLARCEGASLRKSETEIDYDGPGALTDMSVTIDGTVIGVSVTRAFVFPTTDPYTVERATELLVDKLQDILDSSSRVVAADAWEKQILVVVAYADMHADSIATAWAALDPAIRADSIVYTVVTDGADDPLY